MKGLELAERYFEEVGFEMLKRDFAPHVERIAADIIFCRIAYNLNFLIIEFIGKM